MKPSLQPGKRLQLEYNVFGEFTVAAGGYMKDQSILIVNPNADFYLTGMSGSFAGAGNGAILLKDADGRAIANEPVWFLNFAYPGALAQPLEGEMLVYPPDGVIRFDLQETSGAGSVDLQLNFWGFKLYHEGMRKC